MDGPQDDLIEQIISASLEKQAALRGKAPAGDGSPDAPAPEETPPDSTGKPPPQPEQSRPEQSRPEQSRPEQSRPEQSQTEQSQTDQSGAELPRAGRALVGLTAALAVAAAVLLIVCAAQFRAYESTVAGLRDAAANIQSIDELRAENQQLRQELDGLQQELEDTQFVLQIAENRAEYLTGAYNEAVSQRSGLWSCLVARDIYARGDPEGSAATLKVLLNSIEHVANEQSYIRGYEYRLWEMMTELVDKLRAEGYLSQGEADTLNNKFSDIDRIPLEEVKSR